ncbi:MAG: methylmalonyl Co-A mutase-associated GTPase MeaB [Saprospiraceae bacterium]
MKRNPGISKGGSRSKKRILTAEEYVQGICSGNRIVLGQAITLVESENPNHRQLANEILEACLPKTGNSKRIGITGTPGVGKSTFIEATGKLLIEKGHKLAVLAVDPSSQRTGGSILGDKTRMPYLATNPQAFVRPSPAGSTLGGVAAHTRETILLCEAAGFDTIFVETVGVGQSETAVYGMVDFFLLLLQPASGDELQGIKRGIVEMADLIAINKADGKLTEAAEKTRREYNRALHLFPPKESGWAPKANTCSALTGQGLEALWETIETYFSKTLSTGWLLENRRRQQKAWLHEALVSALRKRIFEDKNLKGRLQKLESAVAEGRMSVPSAVSQLLAALE